METLGDEKMNTKNNQKEIDELRIKINRNLIIGNGETFTEDIKRLHEMGVKL
jgi:hypothetical protein